MVRTEQTNSSPYSLDNGSSTLFNIAINDLTQINPPSVESLFTNDLCIFVDCKHPNLRELSSSYIVRTQ